VVVIPEKGLRKKEKGLKEEVRLMRCSPSDCRSKERGLNPQGGLEACWGGTYDEGPLNLGISSCHAIAERSKKVTSSHPGEKWELNVFQIHMDFAGKSLEWEGKEKGRVCLTQRRCRAIRAPLDTGLTPLPED